MLKNLFFVVVKSALILFLTIQISSAMKRKNDDAQENDHTRTSVALSNTPEFIFISKILYADIQNDFKILPSIASTCKHWYDCTKQLILSPKEYASATDETLEKLPHLIFLDLQYNSQITDDGLSNLLHVAYLIVGNDTKITDNGLKTLISLTKIDLRNEAKDYEFEHNITANGIQSLKNLTVLKIIEDSYLQIDTLENFFDITMELLPAHG